MVSLVLRFFIRIVLGAVFLVSGGIKLLDPERFYLDLQTFPWFPPILAYPIMLVLPWWELLAAVGILTKRLYAGALFSLAFQLTGFIIVLSVSAVSDVDLSCGCFGDWYLFPNTATHIGFNTTLLILLGILTNLELRRKAVS